jgi:hypothetical protein
MEARCGSAIWTNRRLSSVVSLPFPVPFAQLGMARQNIVDARLHRPFIRLGAWARKRSTAGLHADLFEEALQQPTADLLTWVEQSLWSSGLHRSG